MNDFLGVVFKISLVSLLISSVFASDYSFKYNDVIFEKSNSININATLFLDNQSYSVEILKSDLRPIVRLNNYDF